MRPRQSDLTVYVFALAAMLSGAWLAEQFGTAWSPTLLALVGVVAALWTVYHRVSVAPRLAASDGGTEGRRDGERSTPSERASPSTAEGDGDRSGSDAGGRSGARE